MSSVISDAVIRPDRGVRPPRAKRYQLAVAAIALVAAATALGVTRNDSSTVLSVSQAAPDTSPENADASTSFTAAARTHAPEGVRGGVTRPARPGHADQVDVDFTPVKPGTVTVSQETMTPEALASFTPDVIAPDAVAFEELAPGVKGLVLDRGSWTQVVAIAGNTVTVITADGPAERQAVAPLPLSVVRTWLLDILADQRS